jgi:hypothetical protein
VQRYQIVHAFVHATIAGLLYRFLRYVAVIGQYAFADYIRAAAVFLLPFLFDRSAFFAIRTANRSQLHLAPRATNARRGGCRRGACADRPLAGLLAPGLWVGLPRGVSSRVAAPQRWKRQTRREN